METRAQITQRLCKRPDWPEIEAAKNQRIKDFRAEGFDRQQAGDRAWTELAENYPPAMAEPIAAFDGLSTDDSDFVSASQWVFDNLARQVEPDQAPSAGAWSMLEWARGNRDDFFKAIMPKALEIKAKQASADTQAVDETDDTLDLATLLGGAVCGAS